MVGERASYASGSSKLLSVHFDTLTFPCVECVRAWIRACACMWHVRANELYQLLIGHAATRNLHKSFNDFDRGCINRVSYNNCQHNLSTFLSLNVIGHCSIDCSVTISIAIGFRSTTSIDASVRVSVNVITAVIAPSLESIPTTLPRRPTAWANRGRKSPVPQPASHTRKPTADGSERGGCDVCCVCMCVCVQG